MCAHNVSSTTKQNTGLVKNQGMCNVSTQCEQQGSRLMARQSRDEVAGKRNLDALIDFWAHAFAFHWLEFIGLSLPSNLLTAAMQ